MLIDVKCSSVIFPRAEEKHVHIDIHNKLLSSMSKHSKSKYLSFLKLIINCVRCYKLIKQFNQVNTRLGSLSLS